MNKLEIMYEFDEKKLKEFYQFPNAYIKIHEFFVSNGYELATGANTIYWSVDNIDDPAEEGERMRTLFAEFANENPWFEECKTKLESQYITNCVDIADCIGKGGFNIKKALRKLKNKN